MRRRASDLVMAFGTAGVLFVGATGCGSSEPDTLPPGAWGSTTTVEELSIGVESGADEHMFGSIRGIAVDEQGNIYIADGRPVVVRKYDSDGNFLTTIGRQGQGPGEYASGPQLGIHPAGMLVARDQARRVTFFTLEGEYLDSFPVVGFTTLVIEQGGDILVQRGEGEMQLVKYSLEGEELEEIAFPTRDRERVTFALGTEGVFAFHVENVSAWSPLGYLVTGRNDVYDIEMRKPGGTVRLQRAVRRPALSAEEHAEWETFRQSIIDRALASGRESDVDPVPEVKPIFREIHVGSHGRIWVWRYVEAEKRDDIEPLPERPDRPLLTWREPWTYDVFEPDGTFLGSAVVPELFSPIVIRGEQLWGTHTDEYGVQRVLQLRVIPGSS